MKKKLRKTLALLLACVMVFALAACASNSGDDAEETTTPSSTTTDSGSGSDDIYTVKLMYTSLMTLPSDDAIKTIEDAISSYVQGLGYNLALDIEMVPVADYATTVPLSLDSGEEMDIVTPVFNIVSWVSNGYLLPLDDYLDNELQGTADLLGDWLKGTTIDGSVYAAPCHKGLALTWKYIYDESYVNAIGYDMSQVTDFYSLVDLFAALKEAYPDKIIEGDSSRFPMLFRDMMDTAQVGTYFATVGDDSTLVNYFETDAFREACEYAYEFRQLGYTNPEGSTSTLTEDVMINAGSCIGVTMSHGQNEESMGVTLTASNTYGGTFKAVEIEKTDLTTTGLAWGISYTSENPSAAAQMLNLMWTDEYVVNTLIYGLEDVSYVWNDDHTAIKYPDGLTAETVPYTTILNCGAFSDQFKMYPFEGNSTAEDLEYMAENIESAWTAPLFGFQPNAANVSTQVAALSNVYTQYFNALTYGDVDPAVYLPEFLAALDAAGIDEVMADYQAQVDAWLAAQ